MDLKPGYDVTTEELLGTKPSRDIPEERTFVGWGQWAYWRTQARQHAHKLQTGGVPLIETYATLGLAETDIRLDNKVRALLFLVRHKRPIEAVEAKVGTAAIADVLLLLEGRNLDKNINARDNFINDHCLRAYYDADYRRIGLDVPTPDNL